MGPRLPCDVAEASSSPLGERVPPPAAAARRFVDPALEEALRLDRLPEDRRLAAALIAIGVASLAPLVVVDLAALATRPGATWLLALRTTLFTLGVAAALLSLRVRSAAALDALTLGWALVMAAGALAVGPTRPPTYQLNLAFEVLVVMANWALLPNTLARQAIAGLAHAGAGPQRGGAG